MAETGLGLLDDTPQATPLDLLINAISGTGQYHFPTGDDGAVPGAGGEEGAAAAPDAIAAYLDDGDAAEPVGAGAANGSLSRKRSADIAGSPRLKKIARTLCAHFTRRSPTPGQSRTFSTVELWHPKTGQKSYGKERRILQPPPTLRITGPLVPLLFDITLSAILNPDPAAARVVFSSQTHRIGTSSETIPDAILHADATPTKRAGRDAKKRRLREAAAKTGWGSTLPWERNKAAARERDELADGLTFPGLWVGEENGKNKEFRLELSLGQPGSEETFVVEEPSPPEPTPAHTLDEAALQRVLGATTMDSLMLEAAEQSAQAAKMVESIADFVPPPEATLVENPSIPVPTAPMDAVSEGPPEKPWATFVSDPLTIVSKPSQRTAKARSMASCLSSNEAFSLLVRVNAQTVRTKFMKLDMINDTPLLGARTGKWSPFRFEVIQRATHPDTDDKSHRARFKMDIDREKGVVTYGSIVQLVDVKNGTRSDPFRLVRVDKNEVVVGLDYGHPVSELQRIGLVRLVDGEDDMEGGGRWYLSAPGAMAGAGEAKTTRARPVKKEPDPQPAPVAVPPPPDAPPADPPATLNGLELAAAEIEVPESSTASRSRKKKTARHALARAAINEEEEGSTAAGLVWHRAQQRQGEYTVTEGKVATTRQATIETVDDWMCWVLSGVWCFSHSFFNGLGDEAPVPKAPLDNVPRILINPTLRPSDNTVELTLSSFFVSDPETGAPQPYSVYLGPIGPLHATTWRSAAPKDKYYDPSALYAAYPYSGTLEDTPVPDERRVFSNIPYSVTHVIAAVELPSIEDIVHAMEEQDRQPEPEPTTLPDQGVDPGWLGVMGPATELTIQEAIQNAGKPHHGDHDVSSILQAPLTDNKDEFEMSNLINPAIDATLPAPPPVAVAAVDDTMDVVATGEAAPVPTIAMHRPERPKEAMAPLPLLLVRPDGVGHGIGWSIMARRETATDMEVQGWGLQIVQTSALGQTLAW